MANGEKVVREVKTYRRVQVFTTLMPIQGYGAVAPWPCARTRVARDLHTLDTGSDRKITITLDTGSDRKITMEGLFRTGGDERFC